MIGRPSASAPLTGAQREASDPRASAWVEASAGTGKTQVLTARVLRLLLGGTAPSRILCLTFTKAAAAEMATRLARRLGDWTVAEDDVLADEIAELTGAVPDGLLLGRARRLFARVLDAPGGMRIMTIHAFCQSVLRRFPLEAGVAPHFTVLDEAMADELMAEARDAVLRAEASMPALGDPLARIAAWVDEDGFAELMGGLAKERGRLGRALEAHGGIEGLAAAIRARHGVAGVKDEAELLAAACAEGAFDRAALEAAAQALLAGGKSDTKCGRAIADCMAVWVNASAGSAGCSSVSPVKRRAYRPRQHVARVGFRQELRPLFQLAVVDDRVVGVTRGVENPCARPMFPHRHGDVAAGHAAGQDHVGQDQVDR